MVDLRAGNIDEWISNCVCRAQPGSVVATAARALGEIIFRWASYAFHTYSRGTGCELVMWEGTFAVASTATPLFLGASMGAIASGKLGITVDGEYTASYLTGWMSPLAPDKLISNAYHRDQLSNPKNLQSSLCTAQAFDVVEYF